MLNSEVIGQQDIWNRLMEMVQENRVPHALMFCGPQGCGKLAVALAFASYLLGERNENDAAAKALPPMSDTKTPRLLHAWQMGASRSTLHISNHQNCRHVFRAQTCKS